MLLTNALNLKLRSATTEDVAAKVVGKRFCITLEIPINKSWNDVKYQGKWRLVWIFIWML